MCRGFIFLLDKSYVMVYDVINMMDKTSWSIIDISMGIYRHAYMFGDMHARGMGNIEPRSFRYMTNVSRHATRAICMVIGIVDMPGKWSIL